MAHDRNDSPPEVRRFPLPWRVAGSDSAYWVVDGEGKTFGYCYFVDRAPRADEYGKLTRAEALRIARNIARLPELRR